MKRSFFSTLTAITVSLLLATGSCKNAGVTSDPTPGPSSELRVSAPFADQTTQFAFAITRRVSAEKGQNKNLFISPLSLHMLLGMILNGANGQTAQEIQKTLKLDAQTLTEANQTYQGLLDNLPTIDPQVTLNLANSVWYRNTFTVETAFQDLLRQTFKADIAAQNFTDPATVGTINRWASDKTNGKIPKVIDQIQSNSIMFLLNALYFKGDWKMQFDPGKTVDAPFKLASGETVNVRMMRLNTNLKRGFRSTYTAFELPYGSDKFAMTVLLPVENTTADALINSFDSVEWAQLQKDLVLGNIDIGLPKFTVNDDISLANALSALGMPTAFTDQADFTKINKKGGILLSSVKQNTYVAVDERGTEAAAVSTGEVVATAMPQATLCNRPFVFVIHEKTTGTVLFVGKIANPMLTNS